MKLSCAIRFIMAMLLAGLSYSAQAADKWLRADTTHFIIYSGGSEQRLREFATDLERFDAVLRYRFHRPDSEKPNRLTVYVLDTPAAVGSLMGGGRMSNAAGFYNASSDGSFAVASRVRASGKYQLSGLSVLLHEYAHHFMFRELAYAYPLWFSEGFAEYFTTVTFTKDGRANLGIPAYHRAYGLVLSAKVPIEKILLSDRSELKRSEDDNFYGRSWALVHMLMSTEEGRDKLAKYLADFGHGADPKEAALKNLGDFKDLDAELEKYIYTNKMAYMTLNEALPYKDVLSIHTLDTVESEVLSLQIQRLAGKDIPGVRAQLAALAQREPARKEAWLELALAELTAADQAEKDDVELDPEDADIASLTRSESAVDKALALDENYVRANALKARILIERLARADKDDPAMLKLARSHILRANRADPEDPLPLILWHESYTRFGETPTQAAHDGLDKAFYTIPEATDVRVRYAYDLAGLGKYDEAIWIVRFLANDPHAGERGKAVLERLEQMKRDAARSGQKAQPDPSRLSNSRLISGP